MTLPIDSNMKVTEPTLNTIELLEKIFVQLPFLDILRARAVCQQWNAIITSSLPLKQATFRTTDSKQIIGAKPTTYDDDYQEHLPEPPISNVSWQQIEPCPLLPIAQPKGRSTIPRKMYERVHYLSSVRYGPDCPIYFIEIRPILELTRGGPSYPILRSVFLTEPPCAEVSLHVGMAKDCTLRDECGITIGHAADALDKLMSQPIDFESVDLGDITLESPAECMLVIHMDD